MTKRLMTADANLEKKVKTNTIIKILLPVK